MYQQLSLNISFPRVKNIGANSDTLLTQSSPEWLIFPLSSRLLEQIFCQNNMSTNMNHPSNSVYHNYQLPVPVPVQYILKKLFKLKIKHKSFPCSLLYLLFQLIQSKLNSSKYIFFPVYINDSHTDDKCTNRLHTSFAIRFPNVRF